METRRLKEYCKKTAWNNMPLTIPAVTKIKVHRIPEELKHKQKQRFYGRTLLTTEQWHREIRSFYTGTWYGSPFTSKPWWRAPMSKSSAPGSGTLTNEDGVTVADLTRFIKKKWKGDKAQKYYFAFMSVQWAGTRDTSLDLAMTSKHRVITETFAIDSNDIHRMNERMVKTRWPCDEGGWTHYHGDDSSMTKTKWITHGVTGGIWNPSSRFSHVSVCWPDFLFIWSAYLRPCSTSLPWYEIEVVELSL